MLRRNQGFLCADCPKLFPLPQPPAPAPSPAPGDRKRAMRRLMNPATLFQMITKERHSEHRASTPRDGVKIRGRWSAPCTYSIFHTLSSLLKCNQPRPTPPTSKSNRRLALPSPLSLPLRLGGSRSAPKSRRTPHRNYLPHTPLSGPPYNRPPNPLLLGPSRSIARYATILGSRQ